MSEKVYGPVPLSRIKTEYAGISAAFDRGERVLVSRNGDVVAELSPPARLPSLMLTAFAANVRFFPEITLRDFNRGNIAEYVATAESGFAQVVTNNNRLEAVLAGTESQAMTEEVVVEGATVAAGRAQAAAAEAVVRRLPPDTSPEDVFRALMEAPDLPPTTIATKTGDVDQTSSENRTVLDCVRTAATTHRKRDDLLGQRLASLVSDTGKLVPESEQYATNQLANAWLTCSRATGQWSSGSLIAENNLLVHLAMTRRLIGRWVVDAMRSATYAMRKHNADDPAATILEDNLAAMQQLATRDRDASGNPHLLKIALDGSVEVDVAVIRSTRRSNPVK